MMGSIQSHQTSNPNSIAQKAAVEALTGPQDTVEAMTMEFEKRKEFMYERIVQIPHIHAIKPQGAFYIFVDVSEVLNMEYKGVKVESTERMAEILIEDFNVAVVPCADFGFPDHMRLSYAISREQIGKGLDRIKAFVETLS